MTIHVQAAVVAPHASREGSDFIRSFKQLRQRDVRIAGTKGAGLGELQAAHFPVPQGFVITTEAYLRTVERAGVRAELRERAEKLRAATSASQAHEAAACAALVEGASLPPELQDQILTAYHQLGDSVRVAVRASSAEQDLDAGCVDTTKTVTNVCGDAAVLDAVTACWAGLWDARAVSHRVQRDLTEEPATAVVVQHMIDATQSGVMFTSDSPDGQAARVVIEAAFGLGETLSTGQVEPDTYVVSRSAALIVAEHIGDKSHKVVAGRHGSVRVELSVAESSCRVLSNHEVLQLAGMAADIERHYGSARRVAWCIREGTVYILEARQARAPS